MLCVCSTLACLSSTLKRKTETKQTKPCIVTRDILECCWTGRREPGKCLKKEWFWTGVMCIHKHNICRYSTCSYLLIPCKKWLRPLLSSVKAEMLEWQWSSNTYTFRAYMYHDCGHDRNHVCWNMVWGSGYMQKRLHYLTRPSHHTLSLHYSSTANIKSEMTRKEPSPCLLKAHHKML